MSPSYRYGCRVSPASGLAADGFGAGFTTENPGQSLHAFAEAERDASSGHELEAVRKLQKALQADPNYLRCALQSGVEYIRLKTLPGGARTVREGYCERSAKPNPVWKPGVFR